MSSREDPRMGMELQQSLQIPSTPRSSMEDAEWSTGTERDNMRPRGMESWARSNQQRRARDEEQSSLQRQQTTGQSDGELRWEEWEKDGATRQQNQVTKGKVTAVHIGNPAAGSEGGMYQILYVLTISTRGLTLEVPSKFPIFAFR